MDENKSLVWHDVNKERPPTEVLLAVVIEGREEDAECTSELARLGADAVYLAKAHAEGKSIRWELIGHSPHTPDFWLELPPTS